MPIYRWLPTYTPRGHASLQTPVNLQHIFDLAKSFSSPSTLRSYYLSVTSQQSAESYIHKGPPYFKYQSWSKQLHNSHRPLRTHLMMMAVAKPLARQPRKWTIAEDQKLREEVEAQSTYNADKRFSCELRITQCREPTANIISRE